MVQDAFSQKHQNTMSIFWGVNCKGCKYERLYLQLRTGIFAPTRSLKFSYAQEQKLSRERI